MTQKCRSCHLLSSASWIFKKQLLCPKTRFETRQRPQGRSPIHNHNHAFSLSNTPHFTNLKALESRFLNPIWHRWAPCDVGCSFFSAFMIWVFTVFLLLWFGFLGIPVATAFLHFFFLKRILVIFVLLVIWSWVCELFGIWEFSFLEFILWLGGRSWSVSGFADFGFGFSAWNLVIWVEFILLICTGTWVQATKRLG